jgi:PAS domain S-box-containing protein
MKMRILITVDHADDRTRILRLLQDSFASAELVAVADQPEYEQALADGPFDLVLTDHALSWADGLALLRDLQVRMPGVPVIWVSGANDERIAVEGMKAGLSDYIPKAHLEQLPAAVTDALSLGSTGGDAGHDAKRPQLLKDLREQIRELHAALDSIADAVIVYGPHGEILRMNAAAEQLSRYQGWAGSHSLTDQLASWEVFDPTGEPYPPHDLPMARAARGETVRAELLSIQRGAHKEPAWVTITAAPIRSPSGRPHGAVATITDVTALLQTQHQLEDANAMLEEQTAELEEQTEEIRNQNEELHVLSERLDEERARLQAILGALPVGVHIADAAGELIDMNDLAHTIWGLRKELTGPVKTLADRSGWWTDTGEPVQADEWALARALRHGEICTAEMVDIERFDGSKGTILNSAAPIYDAAERISGAVSVSQDITEHRELQTALDAERELLQIIYDTVPVMFSVYDPSLGHVVLNKHFERVTGWTQADTAAIHVMELVYPDPAYRAEVAAFMQALEPGFRDIRMVAKGGEVVESSWANVRLPDGRQVGIGLDITERKRAEASLAHYAEELELLNQTNQMLLREVNHRVKNNLTAILGLIYAEKRRLISHLAPGTGGTDPSHSLCAIMDDLAQRVGSLATVHTLLSASGWRPLRLDHLAGQVIEAAAPAGQNVQRLVIDVEPSPVHVTAEQAHHVALVIGELVTNSVKYGCCDQELHISLQSEQDNGHVHLVYRDRGAGYPTEVLAGDTRSVGLGLLNTIVDISLRGTWSMRNDNGAVTELRFPQAGS